MPESPRLVKRYNNRRLYDFGLCRYVTLRDVRALAVKGTAFKAVDTAGRNITREVLLQVLLEREKAGKPSVNEAQLLRLVRSGR
jgi:polyhydroxyalkanoate synthesis repressor PhaR